MGWVTIPKPRWFELDREFNLRRDAAVLRGPVEWSWDVTNRCIGRCLHCLNRSGVLAREELSDREMADVAQQIAAQRPLAICLCGGEPLLRLEAVVETARVLAGAGVSVSMVTTGDLATPEVARRVADAGVRLVQVSVDGATAASHERLRQLPGAFERAWAAIAAFRAAGMSVGVSFVPTRQSIGEWREVYDRCRSEGVADLRMQPLMPLGQCHFAYEEIAPTPEQYRQLVEEVTEFAWGNTGPTRVEWGDPVDHLVRFGQALAMVTHMLHLTADGSLAVSIYLPVLLGNLRRHCLDDYWQAGLGEAWQLRLVREMAYRVRSNHDFAAIRPHPFFDLPIDLDLIDLGREGVERLSDTVLAFLDRVWPAPDRPGSPARFQEMAV
ncbi:MAG TPA: radical SAM protein [Thermoanaerobaculaceae bacterium]|nr:radical SAM protein [Thermoanaerobaculaceae bacterium]HRS15560.1 radical SAM protein [Thermoanaerobaculaceae bacterium]